jgi:tetratricopeptide (TPR) repeat protein
MATEACEVAMETLPTAREIKHAYSRGRVLSSIAEVLGKVGMATESREVLTEAGEAAMKALAAARKTKNASYRATILISIAEDLVKAEMVPEALAAAREIEKRYDRAKALYSIAKELVKAEMVPEALAAAREVEVAYDQAEGLMAVVDFWLGRRQGDEARNLLEEVQGVVSKVFDDLNRSNVMQHLAIILARLHSYRAARETAMQCFSSEHRLAAYIAILREYHIERDPGLAQLFAKEEEEEED